MSIKEIIKALRRGLFSNTLLSMAADELEKLESENDLQKEEIRRLKYQINRLKKYDEERDIALHSGLIATSRAEAVKEFAERLKLKVDIDLCEAIECSDYLYNLPKLIDNLIKEMVGEG